MCSPHLLQRPSSSTGYSSTPARSAAVWICTSFASQSSRAATGRFAGDSPLSAWPRDWTELGGFPSRSLIRSAATSCRAKLGDLVRHLRPSLPPNACALVGVGSPCPCSGPPGHDDDGVLLLLVACHGSGVTQGTVKLRRDPRCVDQAVPGGAPAAAAAGAGCRPCWTHASKSTNRGRRFRSRRAP